jgi:hypothetical protein
MLDVAGEQVRLPKNHERHDDINFAEINFAKGSVA